MLEAAWVGGGRRESGDGEKSEEMGSSGVWRRQSPDKTGERKRTGCETGRQTYRQTEGDAGKTQVGQLLRQKEREELG